MAKAMGETLVKVAGREYRLRLTMRSLAVLQDEFGVDLLPILEMDKGGIPDMRFCLRLIELALQKHHGEEATPDLADDILSEDMEILGSVIAAAFPDPAPEKTPAAAA